MTHQGVKVDQGNIEAMVAWPRPTNISELRGFLGLIGYYMKFVQNYGILAALSQPSLIRDNSDGTMKQKLLSLH